MDDPEKTDELAEKRAGRAESVLKLRQDLRNGRTNKASGTVGESGESTGRVSESPDTEIGATFQDARGESKRLTPTGNPPARGNRRDTNNGRSPQTESRPIRRTTGRSGESNGSSISAPTADEHPGVRSVGRLETDEPILLRPDEPEATFEERQDNRPVPPQAEGCKEDYYRWEVFGKFRGYSLRANKKVHITTEQYEALPNANQLTHPGPTKEPAKARREDGELPWYKRGKTLSAREAQEFYEPLVAALQDDLHYLDELLWLQYPHGAGKDIWGNLDDDEASLLARMMLKRAQHNPAAAAAVRGLVDSKDIITVAEITIPRVILTYQLVKSAPPRQRKPLTIFRKVNQ